MNSASDRNTAASAGAAKRRDALAGTLRNSFTLQRETCLVHHETVFVERSALEPGLTSRRGPTIDRLIRPVVDPQTDALEPR